MIEKSVLGGLALLAIACSSLAQPAAAQRVATRFHDSAQAPQVSEPAMVLLPAFAGSSAGALSGWYLGGVMYDATGCCGRGDDPGLSGRLGLAAGLSVIGAAAIPALLTHEEFGPLLSASTIGVLPAALGAWAGLVVSDGSGAAAVFSYAATHALFVQLIAPHLEL